MKTLLGYAQYGFGSGRRSFTSTATPRRRNVEAQCITSGSRPRISINLLPECRQMGTSFAPRFETNQSLDT
jgi:hypothetical protein